MTRSEAFVVVDLLAERGLTVATAESLTAGLVSAAIADVPGCSTVLRGGIVAYHVDAKHGLLGVPGPELARSTVSGPVALAMADGARSALRADVGVAATGVAGPEPHGGEPIGSVWVAVASGAGARSRHLQVEGDRQAIREAAVEACLQLLLEVLTGAPQKPRE